LFGKDSNETAQRLQVVRIVGFMFAAQICCLSGFSAFASTLVKLTALWHLDSTRAGWISSAYFIGYTIGVPLLVALTDRVDARAIYLTGCATGAIAGCGFALFANGFWSACLFQALAGLAAGGTYMPGLRVMTGRLTGRTRIRAVPYYTTAFAVGISVSFLISGLVEARYGWRAAFLAGGVGSAFGAVFVLLASRGIVAQREVSGTTRHPLDFRPVLRNHDAMAYVLAYGGHCWELFAFRAWLPTYLFFAWHRFSSADAGLALSRWSMLIVLVGVPASIIGAESANPESRNRLIRRFEFGAIAACGLTMICGHISFGLALAALFAYNIAIAADSGALTAGIVSVARADEQGATLAIYSLVGFMGGAIGPLLVGNVLDRGGGFGSGHAWLLGFAAMGTGSALAAVAISRASGQSKASFANPPDSD
jgi:MFS family permease